MAATDFRLRHILALVTGLFLLTQQALAFDPATLGQVERTAASLRQDLTRIQNELSLPTLSSDQLVDLRRLLDDTRASAVGQSAGLNGSFVEVNQQLQSIGAAPANGSSEPQEIADRRADLVKSLARIKAAQAQLDLIAVETDQQIDRLTQLQRAQFLSRL